MNSTGDKMLMMLKKTVFLLITAAFCVVPWVFCATRDYAPGLAVISGIIFSVAWGNPFSKVTSKLTSPLLGATIVGMGFGMDLMKVLRAGADGFIYTMIGIVCGIGFGVLIGKMLKLPKNVMYLVSVGTSICGGSAIAAAAPALKAKAHDVAMASATVFTLNAIALLIFPWLGHALDMSQEQFGYFAALAIHDTSSVVGATLQYGAEALEVGTTVKLARALWIVPVTVFLSCFVAEREAGEKRTVRFKIPWFIPGFIAAAAIVTYLPQLWSGCGEFIVKGGGFLKNLSKYMMIVTLFLIGANLSREKLRELGWRPVIQGTLLWLLLSAIWCMAIVFRIVRV